MYFKCAPLTLNPGSATEVDDTIKIIKKYGKGAKCCKTDISNAFELVPVHPSLWHLYGFKWNDNYYFYTRLAFGSRSSPKIFDCIFRP